MKWIFAFLLAVAIFGAAALFTYKIFIRPELVMRAERNSSATAVPRMLACRNFGPRKLRSTATD